MPCLLLIHLATMLIILYINVKLEKPHASTKCIVLCISPVSTKCTYGPAVKLFCKFSSRSDDHVHPAKVGKVDGRWNSLKAYASGVLGKNIIIAT
jgi:hypothetical protein